MEIDLAALCKNFLSLSAATPSAIPAAVVKCNAYGLGLEPVSKALARHADCKQFFVAYPETGQDLRNALQHDEPNAEIFVFNGPSKNNLELFSSFNLTPVLNTLEQAVLWAGRCQSAPAALHVDVGMNRLGLDEQDIDAVLKAADLNIAVIMSHFSHASIPGHPSLLEQQNRFEEVSSKFKNARKSLASTGGALIDPRYGYDLTRLGIGLYGIGPFGDAHPQITPVARLTGPVLQIRHIKAGEAVGYDGAFVCNRDSKIATISLGYGDGFPRAGSNSAFAMVGEARCPIVGRISMDLITLDVTDIANMRIGDRAEFFGPALKIEETAAACGTIGYELLTSIGPRVDRHYCWEDEAADASLIRSEGNC